MKLNYIADSKERDEQFLALFSLGIVSALKDNAITCDDAWNWLLNIRTLKMLEEGKFDRDIAEAIHLGTELGDVKRIVPGAYINACDEIITLLKRILKKSAFSTNKIEYLLELKN